MNSKEALEKISYCYVNAPSFQELCEIIKQDLERLENLEYVLLLIVDYGLIDLKPLEDFMGYEELEAMQKAFKEVEDKIKRSGYDK